MGEPLRAGGMTAKASESQTYLSGEDLIMISRPELVRRFDLATRRPLTTLIAPPGYGKTTLIEQWREQHEADHSLLSAEEANHVLVDTPETLAPLVIIDDSHRLSQDALEAAIGLITSSTHRVMLAGRHRPGSRLGSLAAAGLVSTIDADDLAFSDAETAAILDRVAGTARSDELLRTLAGWPALVRIHCEYARGDASGITNSWRTDFLEQEVLAPVSDADREFLAALAFVEEVTTLEAVELTGFADAARRMARLQNSGLPLRWRHPAMDIHPALRRHLLARTLLADPDHATEMASRATQVLERRGQHLDAIAFAFDWGLPARAADIMRRRFFHLLYTATYPLMAQLDRIRNALEPWEVTMMMATLVAGLGQTAPEVALRTIRRQLPAHLDQPTQIRVAAHEMLLARQCAYVDIDLSTAHQVAEDIKAARMESADETPELALFRLEYGVYLMHHGECAPAQEWLIAAMTSARLTDLPVVIARGFAAQAWLAARDGDTQATHQLADLSEEFRGRYGLASECSQLARLARASNHLDRGEIDQSRAALRAYHASSRFPRADTMALAVHIEGMIRYVTRDANEAAVVRAFLADSPKMTGYHEYLLLLSLTACLSLANRFEQIDKTIARIRDIYRPEYGFWPLLQTHLLLAEGRPEATVEVARHALGQESLRPKERLHLFVQLAIAADQVNQEKVAEQAVVQAEELATRLDLNPPGLTHLHRFQAPERNFEVSLTDAEGKVLRHLDEGLKVNEIAERMYVSPNTVKTHLRKAYRKLAVNSKRAALDRARALRLL